MIHVPAQPEQGLTSRFVVTALRHWWKVALPVALLLAGVGGTIVYLLFEPVYEASALFQIDERTPYLAFESKEEGRSKLFFQTQIETIRSPMVLGPVVKRPEIAKAPEISGRSTRWRIWQSGSRWRRSGIRRCSRSPTKTRTRRMRRMWSSR